MHVDLEPLIVHEADGLIVVDKPSGLSTSGRNLEDPDCLQWLLMQREGGRVWVVHQLDKWTTGLNLFVTRKPLVARWAGHLQAGRKLYTAIAHGVPTFQRTIVDVPLGYIPERASYGVTPEGRRAVSHVEVLATTDRHCLLRVRIETGRTHQVRLHLSHCGHPLVGEPWYRDPPCTEHTRRGLHAAVVEAGGLRFEAPLPEDLTQLVHRLGLAS